jgi:hypothetical protein
LSCIKLAGFTPAGSSLALPRARRDVDGELFNPTFFGVASIIGEPNRAAHRSSKRL